jgi:soluble lytic murein transglycosylase-like protein
MQVLPATAADYGVTNLDDPHENVRAGSRTSRA